MTFSKLQSGIFFMLKTLGIVALAFIALLLWMPKAHAATATFTGNLITSYGQPSINLGDYRIIKLDVPVQEYALSSYFGWEVEAQGDLQTGDVLKCSFLQATLGGTLYGVRETGIGGEINPDITPVTVEKLDSMEGQLSYTHFDEPVLTRVLPEVYYGSFDFLRLPLVGVDITKINQYIDKRVVVDGKLWYSEYGVAMLTPARMTLNGVEISFI